MTYQNTTSNTITFSSPIKNPIIYAWSIGAPGTTVIHTFSGTFSGTTSPASIAINPEATGMVISGANNNILTCNEGDGLINFYGTFSSISYPTSGTEIWAGYSFVVPLNSNACGNKSFFDFDTDGDGIPNRLDLDSDGDGCPDAVESGVNGVLTPGTIINTTLNSSTGVFSTTGVVKSIATGPYGANGLADGVETTVDSGTVTYTNNYLRYAVDKNISYCTDSDGDGIPDAIDIDDDNDGIRDYIEQGSCPTINATSLTFSGSTNTVKFNGNSISAISTTNGTWQTAYSNQSLALPIHLEFRDNGNANYMMFGLLPIAGAKTLTNYTDDAYKQYFNNTYAQGYYPNTGTTPTLGYPANTNLVPGELWQMDIDKFGFVTITRNGAAYKSFQGVNSNYYLAVSSYNDAITSPRVLSDVLINAKSVTYSGTTTLCSELDSDGDGIPNRLDLDSDGDRCTDVYEASVNRVSGITIINGNVINGNLRIEKERSRWLINVFSLKESLDTSILFLCHSKGFM
jgi:hypothetical protein